jgi:hypothetical protein
MSSLIVSLHDVAPSTAELSRRWVEELDAIGVRASLLVVPGRWNGASLRPQSAFVQWLHEVEERGHEIVMHGLHHTARKGVDMGVGRSSVGKLMARGCEEFWGITEVEARRLLNTGLAIMNDCNFQPRGFVPPGWLMSDAALAALKAVGFEYSTTHTHVIDIANSSKKFVLAMSQRPRSLLSPIGAHLTRIAGGSLASRGTDIRVAIHPRDLLQPLLRDTNLSLCKTAISCGADVATYAEFLDNEMRTSLSRIVGGDWSSL